MPVALWRRITWRRFALVRRHFSESKPMFVHDNHRFLCLTVAMLLSVSLPLAAHQVESTQPVTISTAPVMATGTVSELTVTNQVTGVTLRYLGLKLDQGTSYALAGSG